MSQPLPAPHPTDASETERDRIVTALSGLSLSLMWALRQRAMQTYEPLGIRPTRVLLMELIDRGIDRPKQLAEVLEATPPAITAMVNELVDRTWVQRDVDRDDRRRARLRLTPAGHAALARFRTVWHETSRADLDRVDLADLEAVLRVFERLLERRP